jgi:hypothetical protein
MCSVFLKHDRVYANFVAVEIAEDLFLFIAELAEHPVVLLKEPVESVFGFLRIFERSVVLVYSDHRLIAFHTHFEERFDRVCFIKFFISPQRAPRIYSAIVEDFLVIVFSVVVFEICKNRIFASTSDVFHITAYAQQKMRF